MSLADVIAKELEREGIEVTWDKITRETRARQERVSDQDDVNQIQRSHAFGRALVKPSELVEDRPAILKPPRHPPPSKPVLFFMQGLKLLEIVSSLHRLDQGEDCEGHE